MRLTEDKNVFFADFGVVADLGGSPVSVIYDNEFLAQLGLESSNPMAYAKAADVLGVLRGTNLVIPAGEFNEGFVGFVVGCQPDGTGFAVLELEEA